MTRLLRIDPDAPEPHLIMEASKVIKRGGTVAFPTETVYGLGANALDPEAVRKVFSAKGRPSDNPLIVHISDMKQLDHIARKPSKMAGVLMKKFWPGPLTIILKKKKVVPDMVTGGLDTVAVRMPDNVIARALIRDSGVPLVAPSANLSGRPSPTKAKDVTEDLWGRIDMIIDGGGTRIGIESTVIDMTTSPPTILRFGGLAQEAVEKITGPVASFSEKSKDAPVRSPGLKYRHYAPKARIKIIEGPEEESQAEIRRLAVEAMKMGKKVGILSFHKEFRINDCVTRYAGTRPDTVARRLFDILRGFDRDGVDIIFSEGYGGKGLAKGIADRLKRAAGKK